MFVWKEIYLLLGVNSWSVQVINIFYAVSIILKTLLCMSSVLIYFNVLLSYTENIDQKLHI